MAQRGTLKSSLSELVQLIKEQQTDPISKLKNVQGVLDFCVLALSTGYEKPKNVIAQLLKNNREKGYDGEHNALLDRMIALVEIVVVGDRATLLARLSAYLTHTPTSLDATLLRNMREDLYPFGKMHPHEPAMTNKIAKILLKRLRNQMLDLEGVINEEQEEEYEAEREAQRRTQREEDDDDDDE